MNKELILKYKAEFDHWLNGGKILYASYDLDEKNYSAWYELHHDCKWDYNNAYRFKFIINDAFVEFRKALAEGKTLQYNFGNFGTNKKDFPDSWKDLDLSIGILADRACPENYRIKPEESKFKVGDWVRDKKRKHKPFMVTSSDLETDSPNYVKIDCELWQPQPGEWCWVGYKLMKFNKLIKEDYSTTFEFISPNRDVDGYKIKEHILERHLQIVEPFIGQLPSYLKE